jgi:CheY-like chemotaxis protein/HAMP domain-containing protein/putative methionine-R-sulfoxide reductase with GAF domain
LLVSLIPLALTNIIFLKAVDSSVRIDTLNDLTGRLEIKKETIEKHFHERIIDVHQLAGLRETVDAIADFSRAIKISGSQGEKYKLAVTTHGTFFTKCGKVYGYDDLLLINPDGDVVYSNTREADYLTSLTRGPYAGTSLALAFKKSLRGEMHLADYTLYGPANDRPVMFLSMPIEVDNAITGVLAIRLSGKAIMDIMAAKDRMGETGETYLVGRDNLLRSNLRFKQTAETDVMRTRIATDSVREAFSGASKGRITTDYRGENVLSVSSRINIEGMDWTIISEIDEKEAAASITALRRYLLILSLLLGTAIFVVAWFFAKGLTRPLIAMAEVATELTRGNLKHDIEILGKNEIGDLAQAFQSLIESQREVSDTAEAIARGDLDVAVKEKSSEDILARSINQMVMITKDTVNQAKLVAGGDYSTTIVLRSDKDELGIALQTMISALRRNKERNERQDWLQQGVRRLNEVVIGEEDLGALVSNVISEMATWLDAKVGAFYITTEDVQGSCLKLLGTFAYTQRKNLSNHYRPGEGLIGQAALEKKQILVKNVPEDYIRIVSGLGESSPRALCVTPLIYEGVVKGVIEIASFSPLTEDQLEYLDTTGPSVAVAIEVAQARDRVVEALQKAEQLATELKAQQNILQHTNAELEEQTAQLKISEQKLQQQQSVLEHSNFELEEQTAQLKTSEQKLQQQQIELEVANDELIQTNTLLTHQKAEIEQARTDIATQAEEVALASKYKSEFLANMSHELRTPLNSLLLLARSLRENGNGNLTDEQVESADVIFQSGSDLLNLINEILDLSKIEAGRMELHLEEIDLMGVERTILSQFDHMAKAQNLAFKVEIKPGTPSCIISDNQRLGQILKNLIGNALKFTEMGGVTVRFARPEPGISLARSGLNVENALAIHVQDTGIGIPREKQKIIFEAFQQADSGDRRRFGGTGLGLSISREIAVLLGGELQLQSETGKGSTFSLYIPLQIDGAHRRKSDKSPFQHRPAPLSAIATPLQAPELAPSVPAVPIEDDRDSISETDRVMLIIEDDLRFGKILARIIHERGFKCIIAATGENGLELAREHKPNGVILDIQLPGMDGWAVLNILKQDVSLRHIPVHIVSVEETSTQNLRAGAIGHIAKPIDREKILEVLDRLEAASARAPKRVLVVEDDELMRKETVRIIGNGNVTVEEVATGKDAIAALLTKTFDLAVVDLGLPDMQGIDLLKHIADKKISLPPVIIHTVRDLTIEEEHFLRNYAESIIIKDVRSQERLIDEVALFLHRVVRDLPEENRRAILHLRESDEPLRGKKVLIVEDDMRTMFAMARMLAGHGVTPLKADQGQRALAILEENPDVDLILMDIMMPVMDGYEATKLIRGQDRFAKLPIIALTAKAMKEDRQKCLEAGATDYLSKPVDPERLTSLMRVLLSR